MHVEQGSRMRQASRRGRLTVVTAALTLAVLTSAWLGNAQPAAGDTHGKAVTHRQARNEALQSIPFDQLNRDAQEKILSVVRKPTLFRRMPLETIESDPDLYLFLVRHPDVVVNMWELMGITRLRLQRTGDYHFQADDGAGTRGKLELVYGTSSKHIFYAEGAYDGPLSQKQLAGRCVVILHSTYRPGTTQASRITSQLDIFVELDNPGADLVAKTLHPLIGKTADHNFAESARFLAQVSEQAEQNEPGMQRLVSRLANIDGAVRAQFSRLVHLAGTRDRESTSQLVTTGPSRETESGMME